MTFFEITSLTAGVFHLLLTLFVLGRDLRSNVNRVYALWGGSLVLWNLSGYFKYQATLNGDEVLGKVLTQLLHLGVVFLPVSNFHLYLLIARVSRPKLIRFLYVVHVVFGLSVFTPLYMTGIHRTPFGYYATPGPLLFLFTVNYFVLALMAIVKLYLKQRSLPRLHQTRLRALLLAYVTLFLAGTHDLIPVFAGEGANGARAAYSYPGTNLSFQPLGNLAAIFYGVVVAYTVLQHQLLDIHLTLSRVAAQLVRILFMFFVGFLLLVVLYGVGGARFSAFAFFSSLGVLLLTILLTSILFPRFFGRGGEKLERRILGDRFEYQTKIETFVQRMFSYSDNDLLLDDLDGLLVSTIQVRTYVLILLDQKTRSFSVLRSHPPVDQTLLPGLHLDSPIFAYFQHAPDNYLTYNVAYAMPGETEMETAARRQLREFEPEFCFPLMAGEDPFGLLLVGEKRSEDPYTPYDVELLRSLVKNLSLLINQSRLQDQLLLTQEMELRGMMSRGLAHDLNNLLTPTWTYLQLHANGHHDEDAERELLPIAMRNVETMRSYIKEALFFARSEKPQLATRLLGEVVRAAGQLVEPDLKRKALSLKIEAEPSLVAEIDEVLIKRLFCNLLHNAIDASPPETEIAIKGLRLTRTEKGRYWYRFLICDQGEGISRDNLKRIFTPYFTTKDRRDERRGFGLGLAICRKIVLLHGGNIQISSEVNKGTTVQVDLPSRPINSMGANDEEQDEVLAHTG